MPEKTDGIEAGASAPEKEKSEKSVRSRLAVGNTFWLGILILIILVLLSILALVHFLHVSRTTGHEIRLESNTEEEVDLFSAIYKNKDGNVTVESSDDMKVVAPGTDDHFVICLRNKDNVPIEYTVEIHATLIGQYELPLKFYLVGGPDHTDIVGSGKGSEWVDRTVIDGTSHSGALDVNEDVDYKLHWDWPFDSDNDEYDTFLASVEGEDMGIQISVMIRAYEAEGGGLRGCESCETFPWWWLFVLIPLLIAAIILLIASLRRQKPVVVEVPVEVPVPAPVEVAPVIIPEPVPEPKPEPKPIPAPAPKPKKKEGFVGKMAYINIDTLDANFNDGDKISLAILKARGLLDPRTKQMKVLARNGATLEKKFIIETQGVSAEARAIIVKAGGEIIITKG